MLPPFLRGVVLSDDDAVSSEGTAVAVALEPSFLVPLDIGLSVASGDELESVDSGDDDSDEDVVAGSVAAVVVDGVVTVNVLVGESFALYRLSPAK